MSNCMVAELYEPDGDADDVKPDKLGHGILGGTDMALPQSRPKPPKSEAR